MVESSRRNEIITKKIISEIEIVIRRGTVLCLKTKNSKQKQINA